MHQRDFASLAPATREPRACSMRFTFFICIALAKAQQTKPLTTLSCVRANQMTTRSFDPDPLGRAQFSEQVPPSQGKRMMRAVLLLGQNGQQRYGLYPQARARRPARGRAAWSTLVQFSLPVYFTLILYQALLARFHAISCMFFVLLARSR